MVTPKIPVTPAAKDAEECGGAACHVRRLLSVKWVAFRFLLPSPIRLVGNAPTGNRRCLAAVVLRPGKMETVAVRGVTRVR